MLPSWKCNLLNDYSRLVPIVTLAACAFFLNKSETYCYPLIETSTLPQRALQWFRHEPERLRAWTGDLYLRLLRDVGTKMRNGTARESASSRVLSPGKNMGMTEEELAWAVSAPFSAGVETVSCDVTHMVYVGSLIKFYATLDSRDFDCLHS